MGWFSVILRKAQSARTLGPRNLAMLAEAWLTLGWVRILMKLTPFRCWRPMVQRALSRDAGSGCPGDPASLVRMLRMARRYHPGRVTCLQSAYALHCLLKRRGMASTLRIGVRKAGDGMEAHAWVERHGRVLDDAPGVGEAFSPFRKLP